MDASSLARATRGAQSVRIGDRRDIEKLVGRGTNTDLKTMVQEMVGEVIKENRSKKLTWSRDKPPEVSLEGAIGLWNPNLEGAIYFKGMPYQFHIQNFTLMNAQGVEIAPEDLPDDHETWRNKAGMTLIGPSPREVAVKQLAKHRKDALARDPMICRYCGTIAEDGDERMRHIYREHPAEFAELVGVEAKPAEEPPAPQFVCCGKTFKTKMAIAGHRRFSKAHGGVDHSSKLAG